MGWLWGSNNNASSTKSDGDPLRNLDPSLRDFLEKESPVKYRTTRAPPQTASPLIPATRSENPQSQNTTATTKSSPESSTPAIPPPTLYPDGRYAHLWSTYKPISEIENASKTDQEKLLDVLNAFKERKAEIGRAALENCALEHIAIDECFRNGGVKARMTMCRAENRELERCYAMQSVGAQSHQLGINFCCSLLTSR